MGARISLKMLVLRAWELTSTRFGDVRRREEKRREEKRREEKRREEKSREEKRREAKGREERREERAERREERRAKSVPTRLARSVYKVRALQGRTRTRFSSRPEI